MAAVVREALRVSSEEEDLASEGDETTLKWETLTMVEMLIWEWKGPWGSRFGAAVIQCDGGLLWACNRWRPVMFRRPGWLEWIVCAAFYGLGP